MASVSVLIHGVEGEVTKWAFFERPQTRTWHQGRIVMIGDACHPMKPHMAQGAAIAIEDAAMLLRCIGEAGPGELSTAFRLYEANRMPRANESAGAVTAQHLAARSVRSNMALWL